MYYLNKIVGYLVSPIGGAIVGGIAAVVCARIGRKRLAKWLGGLTVAWLWLWMTPIITWVVGVPLEREFLVDGQVPMVASFPKADAIVLLGGSMSIETNMSSYAEMATSADRVWQAARLYKAEKAATIIATGDYARDSTLQLLKEFGVEEESVSFLDARTTEEEAKGIWKLFSRAERVEGADSTTNHESRTTNHEPRTTILLVTSAWHMKRARQMFKKYAPEIDVVCAPADFENTFTARKTPFLKALLPDPYVFYLNGVALHEWVGIVGYKVFR